MPNSISTSIISSSADRIESLSNDIVSNANQIQAIVHSTESASVWDSICMWFQNYSLKSNIYDFCQMDGWNLCLTLFVFLLSIRVWIRCIRFLRGKTKSHKVDITLSGEPWWRLLGKIVNAYTWSLADTIVEFCRELKMYKMKPMLFDKKILAENGWPLFRLSLKLAVLFPLAVTVLCTPFSILMQILFGGNYASALNVYISNSPETNILWAVISQYMDPGNLAQSDGLGSFLALLLAVGGIVFLSGLMVSSLVNWISQRREQWQNGLISYANVWAFKKYVVIIGCNEQTASIVRQSLRRDGVDYVLIQTRKEVKKARLDLELEMDDELEDRIVFYAGERTSAEDLSKLRLEKAIEIFVLGEDINYENEKDHDAFNANCLDHISDYIRDYKHEHKEWDKRLRVHVDFEYQSTFTAFKATHLYQKLDRDIEFVPFNVHEIWAKKILVDNFAIIPAGKKGEFRVQRYHPVDSYIDTLTTERKGITDVCDKSVHLIVLGMNQMGTALGTQAALLCHFPNFANKRHKRTTITFIDDHAKVEGDYFMGRFATLFELSRHRTIICNGSNLKYYSQEDILEQEKHDNISFFKDKMKEGQYDYLKDDNEQEKSSFLDIDWEFIQGNVASEEVKAYIEAAANDPLKTTTIAICFNQSQQSIAAAMYLPASVYKHANQVLVYQQNCFDIVNDVANGDVEWKRYPNLFPFGMIEGSYTENQFDNHVAKLVHHKYVGEIENNERLLKRVDAEWDQLGIVQKFANIDFADSIHIKYRSMGISNPHYYDPLPDNLDGMVYSEHLRWVTERLMMGFRCLSKEEQDSFINHGGEDEGSLAQKKKRFIGKERAHLDICSLARLKHVDSVVYNRDNDRRIIKGLPELLKSAEWVSILRLSDSRYENSRHVKFLRDFLTNNTDSDSTLHFHFIRGLESLEKRQNETNHSFWMAETPVTQAQWQKVMGVKRKVDANNSLDFEQDDMPVVNVSRQDVEDFLTILRKRTGLYFALPSRKEWIYAALKTIQESKKYDAWVSSETDSKLCPVKVSDMQDRQVSKTRLRHILGNVWEWTREEDIHHRFIFCGGSWRFTHREIALDQEYWEKSWGRSMKSDDIGFRLIWKFDAEGYGTANLYQMMQPIGDNSQEVERESLIGTWFGSESHSRMKLVEAGSFVMGANESIDLTANKDERPRHNVRITENFYMCEIPVTQYLWNLLYPNAKNPTNNRLGDNLPQTDVSWADAMCFINALNALKKDGKLSAYLPKDAEEMVFRLPTEAEWEYAAKGGHLSQKEYDNAGDVIPSKQDVKGNEVKCNYQVKDVKYKLYAGSDDVDMVAWFNDTSIREVALKNANTLGLYDMSGNIWEWCHDRYVWNMYENGNSIDPIATDRTYSAHVFRGGSWRSTAWDCRCTRANFWIASHKSNDLGFRLVLGKPIDSFAHNLPLD